MDKSKDRHYLCVVGEIQVTPRKVEMRKEIATAIAESIVKRYPEIDNVQDIFEKAKNDGYFNNETEALAVWGRLMRLLPATKENA
jgi:hypothetical protein